MDRNALVALAETLDDARLKANANNFTEGEIYAGIAASLREVLALLVVDSVEDTYQSMLDGNTVAEALALGL